MAGGTGIGLYSLSKRVASLNGSYGIRSRDDGQPGSVFFFTAPYRPDKAEPDVPVLRTSDKQRSRLYEELGIPTASPAASSLVHNCHVDLQVDLDSASLPADKKEEKPQQSPTLNPSTTSDPKLRVLLVDDSLVVLKSLGRALQCSGYEVVTAENGQEALNEYFLTAAPRFDMILSDVQMPVMDGLEFCKRLRAQEAALRALSDVEAQQFSPTRNVIFGFMSANTSEDVSIRTQVLGCKVDFILEKPFSVSNFNQHVQSLLP